MVLGAPEKGLKVSGKLAHIFMHELMCITARGKKNYRLKQDMPIKEATIWVLGLASSGKFPNRIG